MVKKTKEEALETRNMLLDTAEQVFHRKGVSGTTLANIADAAGVTRGAIYWHFKNKADLFDAMCDRVRLPLEEMTEAGAGDAVEDPLGRVRTTVDYLYHKVATDQHYRLVFDILFNKCEFVEQLGPIIDRDERVRREFRERFERIFSNAVKLQQLPADMNVALAVKGYIAFTKGVLRDWLLDPGTFDLHRDGMRMVDGYFEMLKLGTVFKD